MTRIEEKFSYGAPPKESAWRAIDDIRDVYGIYGLSFDDVSRTVRVDYDASRLTEGDVAGLLRNAGFDIRERIWDT